MLHDTTRALGRTNLATSAPLVFVLALAGCNVDYKVIEADEGDGASGEGASGSGGSGAVGPGSGRGDSGSRGDPPSLPSSGGTASTDQSPTTDGAPPGYLCRLGGECVEVAVTNIDKIDLLFMIDDSGSMAEEQAALIQQFPKLIEVLTTGDRDGDGSNDFPPAKNLHLGVVSSDLGLVGITGIDHCEGLGDDGVMHDVPNPGLMGCAEAYPRFLTYTAGVDFGPGTGGTAAPSPQLTPGNISTDLACISMLGTEGCGFEQQLESTLKALWPADDARVTFLPDPQGLGALGQGEEIMGGPSGMNAGFLRNDPVMGLSMVSIVLVSDEDDCSSKDTSHLRPPAYLDPNSPTDVQLLKQGLNVRCNFNPQNLYTKERYINGFKALRPGHEDLVLFTALVGVPPATVEELPGDYATSEAAREQFYAGIRNDDLMQPVVDDLGTPSPDDDTMRASCDTAMGKAYPPLRILDVAEGFGVNGLVQSICQRDYGPAFDRMVERMAARLGAVCLPSMHLRDADGLLSCQVIWELPPAGKAKVGTPTGCAQSPFLLPLDGDPTDDSGGALCRVPQLAVREHLGGTLAPIVTETDGIQFSDGWYYDDFSDEAQKSCAANPRARVAFTPGAMPPTGVRVYLDCEP